MMAAAIRVLYVDDDPRLLDLCKVFLEKSGDFAVTTALSAPDAIRLLEQERFDAIISDYQMPDMDGIKFLKQIKANGNKTPFIIITGKGYEKVVIAALNAGADGYFQKSGEPKLHFAELSQKIKKAVESRRVEEALVESEERFRTLVASVNEVIILQEKTGEILTWNRAAERLFGVTSREVLGHTATSWKWKTIREDGTDFPDAEHPSMHTLATGEACKNVVMGITSAEGRFTWVNINTSPLSKQGDANPYAVVISLLDITERKGFEAILQQSENKFATVFRNSPVALTLVSATDGTFVDVNDTFVRSTGYSRDEVIGITSETLGIFVDSNERERMVSTIRDQRCVKDMELKCRIKTGEIQICLFSSCLILLGGKPYIISTIEDITGRKRAEEALRESKRELADIISFLPDATLVIDKNGTVLAWNRAMEEMTGVPAEQILGKGNYEYALPFYHERRPITIDLVLHDNPAVVAKYPVMKKEGNSLLSEIFIPHLNNGRGAHLWFTASPLYDADGNISGAIESIRDITERKRMEDVLKESENRYRSLFEGVPVGRYRTTPSGQILDINPALVRLLGYPDRESLMAVNVFDIFKNPRERTQWIDRIERDGIVPDFEVQFRTYDGTIIWVQDTGESVRDGSGQVIYYNGNVVDITERKKAEDALRESEEKYRTLIDTLNEGIWVIDKDAVTTYVNPKMADILGYTVEEITGRSLFAFVDDEGRRICEQNIERRKQGIKEQHDFEFLKKDGTRIYTSLETSAIKGKDGKYLGAIAGVMDITERKRAQEALRNSEERYRNVVEDQTELICRFLPDGTHIFVNEAYCRYFDRKRGEIIGHRFKPVLHPEDREIVARHIASLTSLNPVMNIDQRIIMPDGNTRWQRWSDRAIFHADGSLKEYQSVGRDITDRKQDEEALQETNEYLHKLIDFGNAPIIVWNPEFEITRFNQASEHLTGRTEQEVIGQKIDTLFPADSRETSLALIKKTLEGKRWETVEIPILVSDGTIRTVLWNTANILTAEAELISTIAQGVDITERKKVEKALRESEEKFRSLVEHALEGIMILDLQGTILFANNAMARTLEADDCAGLIGRNVMEFVASESREDVVKDFIEVSHGHDAYLAQYNIISAKGNNFTVESIGKVIRYEGKHADLVSIRDITERKRVEKALRKSEEIHRLVLEFAGISSTLWTTDGYLLMINRYGAANLNGVPKEFIGKTMTDLFGPEAGAVYLERIRQVAATGTRMEFEDRVPLREDDKWFLSAHTRITDDHGQVKCVMVFSHDITERKQAEDTIKSALAEKEVLLREIHHRVKNNLAGIISLIDLQIGSLTDPVNISVLKDLETRIRSMALVHESLYQTKDLAKINFTSYTENLTRYLFQVYGTATDIRCRIEMEDITMSIDTAIPCGLVINEIVTNSLKYAFRQTFSCQEIRGEPCTITLTLHREGSDYLLKIADNGIGIPEGIDVTMSHSLGLYLIRFIVKHQLRGRLEISTARGTTYTIRFPEPVVKERHSDEKL